ncbi:MAG: transcription-repair coupling factor [Candidatus Puniceispirillum sp.]|nr:transcription-repair coupling factor [Candidatus Puniceispirillum sp.]
MSSALFSDFDLGTKRVLSHVAPGLEAPLILEAFGESQRTMLVVTTHRERMEELKNQLITLDSSVACLTFPAWDTVPYDRVSPRRDIMGARMGTLFHLSGNKRPHIVLTTCAALLQRVPPRDAFQNTALHLHMGQSISDKHFTDTLVACGFRRVETVREPGEFALRGSLVDLFCADHTLPIRVDRFGDEIESLRTFDPLTQRTRDAVGEVLILPSSEVILNEESVAVFRQKFRETFGVPKSSNTLYAHISEGQAHPGMEQWLPFFYPNLASLMNYLPQNAPVFLSDEATTLMAQKLEVIHEHYRARVEGDASSPNPYYPVPYDSHFMPLEEAEAVTHTHPCVIMGAYDSPQEDAVSLASKPLTWTDDTPAFARLEALAARARSQGKALCLAWALESEHHTLKDMLTHQNAAFIELAPSAVTRHTDIHRVALIPYPLSASFEDEARVVISASHLLGKLSLTRARRKRRSDLFIEEACALSQGDLVIHQDHGLGQYQGLTTITVGGVPHDCLLLTYAGDDRLFLPVENLEMITRYGGEAAGATLDKLGGHSWQKRREKVKRDLFAIAHHLMEVAAQREVVHTQALAPDEAGFTTFCQRFAFPETDDQLQTMEEIIEDLASGRPMDRLVCGDVGFGKTEMALRAACIVALSGRQVAVIAPTTLLVRQHFQNFMRRFEGLGVRVAQLSRFITPKAAKTIKEDLASGKVHVVIGTHALLGKGTTFQDLGLMIVDEEQHFGVKQKEKLKADHPDVHLLTLSATPIPRTLQMALSGMRSMSLITTPPLDRLVVRTFVTPFDGLIIREAIARERARSGQVFFVCPRLSDMESVRETLLGLIPDLKIITATGQMAAKDLEDAMVAFCDRQADVLLSTNIIESGLDLPFVNTIIVWRADLFGLSQLYQLRGRVGRAKVRGYAYFTTPPHKPVSTMAQKRLEIMQTLDTLGAGFQLASHDMDLRGTGNLLGEEQSGHVREVGLELYQQMLEEAVLAVKAKAKGEIYEESWSPQMNLGLPVMLSQDYIPDLGVRLGFYRRLSYAKTVPELDDLLAECVDRFGPLPMEAQTLFDVMKLKLACKHAHVDKIDMGDKGFSLHFRGKTFPRPDALIGYVLSKKGAITVRPDQSLVIKGDLREAAVRIKLAARVLGDLGGLLA